MNRSNLYTALALVLGFVIWTFFHDRTLAERVRIDTSRDSTQHAQALHDSVQHLRTQDSLRWAVKDTLLTHQNALRTVFVVQQDSASQQEADSLYEALQRDSVASEDFKTLIRRTVTGLQASRDTLLAVVKTDSTLIFGLRGQLAQRDSTIHDLTALNASNRALVERYRDLASPGLLTQAVEALPWMAGAYVLAKVTH